MIILKFVMYGAGNIGRGFIGEVFSLAGYETAFVDVNMTVVDALNAEHRYPVRVVSADGSNKEIWVENVRGVDGRDIDAVASEIASCDCMATAVGVNIIPYIVKPLAAGIAKRWADGNPQPLNIIICENKIDANVYLGNLLREALKDNPDVGKFDERVGLVEASIGRMVPVMTPEMAEGNPLRVWVEPFCELPIDSDAIRGELPRVPELVPFTPFEFYIRRKLFVHNLGHAICAYLGAFKHDKFIWQAVGDEQIREIARDAMRESALALSKEYNMPVEPLYEHVEDLLTRFGNKQLGDTVDRVGRDTVRKLGQTDRLVGAAAFIERHGGNTQAISFAIAAALLFCPEGDESSRRVADYVKKNGVAQTLLDFSGIRGGRIAEEVTGAYMHLTGQAM